MQISPIVILTFFGLEPPVSWEEIIQNFQLIFIAKEEIDIEDLLQVNVLPNNPCPTLEERVGREDYQARMDREARNAAAITPWREDKHWRADIKGATRGDADKRLKLKLSLSLRKQGQRYFNQQHPYRRLWT